MALKLKACRSCGRKVSSEDTLCPHCGIKEPYKATMSLVSVCVTLFLIFFLLFVCADLLLR